MELDSDTIIAIATPPGRGGIGIVRLSGPRARELAEPVLKLKHPLTHAQARFTHILDDQNEVLDEAVVTFFQAPHSYTSEDVVEISAHGAPILLDFILRAAITRGARLAQPGEFTQRAFLSGRLDLTQAEAVNDLIASHTLHQAKQAAAQLGGSISRLISPIKQTLIELIAALEAGVDFAEDEIDLLPPTEILTRIAAIQHPLEKLAATYTYGRILREGVKLAIVGRPNAGKSSLFNRLLERERAIVTPHPGTTRDPISDRLAIAGIPIELIDTAGLRDIPATPETEAERQGIARSLTTMADADLVLHVVDATTLTGDTLLPDDAATLHQLEGRPHLLLVNKSDLSPAVQIAGIHTSAQTGEGLEALKQAILESLKAQPVTDSATITNLRQAEALQFASRALARAHAAATQAIPHEFLLLDLHESLQSLDTLTGATTPDDILQLIFSSFCIGK